MSHLHLIFDARDLDLPQMIAHLREYNGVLLRHVLPPAWIADLALRAAECVRFRNLQLQAGSLPLTYTYAHRLGYAQFLALQELDQPGGPPLEVLYVLLSSLVPQLLRAYYQADFVIQLASSVFREQGPACAELMTPWHQDGFFQETGLISLNCWVPLTVCGDGVIPSMELMPGSLKCLLEPYDPESSTDPYGPSTLSESSLQALGLPTWTPHFELGDMLIFNSFLPHRTEQLPQPGGQRLSMEIRSLAGTTMPPGYEQWPYLTSAGEMRPRLI